VILTSDATSACPPFPSLFDVALTPPAKNDCASRIKQSKVMIVDDEPLNIKILRRLLELEGFSHFVTTTESPTSLSLIRQELPDLVLLDLMMPYVSGLDILAEVRADESISFIPIVILTGLTARDTRVKAVELGATDFLNKPVDASELLPRVRTVLAVKGFQDQLRNYNHDLELAVRKQTAELERSHRDLVRCLAQAAE
jgi:putative two-component system response regulator